MSLRRLPLACAGWSQSTGWSRLFKALISFAKCCGFSEVCELPLLCFLETWINALFSSVWPRYVPCLCTQAFKAMWQGWHENKSLLEQQTYDGESHWYEDSSGPCWWHPYWCSATGQATAAGWVCPRAPTLLLKVKLSGRKSLTMHTLPYRQGFRPRAVCLGHVLVTSCNVNANRTVVKVCNCHWARSCSSPNCIHTIHIWNHMVFTSRVSIAPCSIQVGLWFELLSLKFPLFYNFSGIKI